MSEVNLKGYLHTKEVGTGSKYAHTATSLKTDDQEYTLKIQNQNPFETPAQLEELIGKRVSVRGSLQGSTLIASSVEPDDSSAE